ncbi:MAG: hypothetical protein J2P36_04745 [Ktedonobacteraceae bacterium]|nr:hypothetical protein [Ktedonobacteraceae bacterium]
MQWCVSFPEEQVVIVRPSLITICAGSHPAAKLLSVLLYRCSLRRQSPLDVPLIGASHKTREKTADHDPSWCLSRTQVQLVTDMCGELSAKTLHDVAIPTLQLLGYVDVDASGAVHRYTLHLNPIRAALTACRHGADQVEAV